MTTLCNNNTQTDRQQLMQKLQQQLDKKNAELLARLDYEKRQQEEQQHKQKLIDDGSEVL